MSEIHTTRVEYFETMDSVQGVCSCGWFSALFAEDEAAEVDAEIIGHTDAEDEVGYYAELAAEVEYEEWLTGASAY